MIRASEVEVETVEIVTDVAEDDVVPEVEVGHRRVDLEAHRQPTIVEHRRGHVIEVLIAVAHAEAGLGQYVVAFGREGQRGVVVGSDPVTTVGHARIVRRLRD
jgi:hypothetical protein